MVSIRGMDSCHAELVEASPRPPGGLVETLRFAQGDNHVVMLSQGRRRAARYQAMTSEGMVHSQIDSLVEAAFLDRHARPDRASRGPHWRAGMAPRGEGTSGPPLSRG